MRWKEAICAVILKYAYADPCRMTGSVTLQGKCSNFCVFQSYELRFSGNFNPVLIRSFPVSFMKIMSQGRVPTTTSDLYNRENPSHFI